MADIPNWLLGTSTLGTLGSILAATWALSRREKGIAEREAKVDKHERYLEGDTAARDEKERDGLMRRMADLESKIAQRDEVERQTRAQLKAAIRGLGGHGSTEIEIEKSVRKSQYERMAKVVETRKQLVAGQHAIFDALPSRPEEELPPEEPTFSEPDPFESTPKGFPPPAYGYRPIPREEPSITRNERGSNPGRVPPRKK